jgi:hypothetical protein
MPEWSKINHFLIWKALYNLPQTFKYMAQKLGHKLLYIKLVWDLDHNFGQGNSDLLTKKTYLINFASADIWPCNKYEAQQTKRDDWSNFDI